MSLQDRIEALKAKHHALEAALEAENSRPRPDDVEISRLKKQKLQIKDEIATLSHQSGPRSQPTPRYSDGSRPGVSSISPLGVSRRPERICTREKILSLDVRSGGPRR